MIKNKLDRAKEIYFHYSCNDFFLNTGDDVKEYRKYNISIAQENNWRREYIRNWIGKLSIDDFQAMNNLKTAGAGEALPELIKISKMGDSLAKLWFADAIWEIALNGGMSPILQNYARQQSILLWKSLINKPIYLTDSHNLEVSDIVKTLIQINTITQSDRIRRGLPASQNNLYATTPNEYISNYANIKLKESEKKGPLYFLFIWFIAGVVNIIQSIISIIQLIFPSHYNKEDIA